MKMNRLRINYIVLLILLIILTLGACKSRRQKSLDVDSVIRTLVGKTVVFPDTITLIQNSHVKKESFGYILKRSKATIVSVIWGDCQVCIQKMNKWNSLKESGHLPEVQFIYIMVTTNIEYFLKVFYPMIKSNGVLLIDDKDQFYRLNGLNNINLEYNTFLVDKSFKIVLVGDPLIFTDLMNLYEQTAKELLNDQG